MRGNTEKVRKFIDAAGGVESAEYSETDGVVTATVISKPGVDVRDDIFLAFASARMPVIEMRTNESTLEDIFLKLAYGSEEINSSVLEKLNSAVINDEDDESYDDYYEETEDNADGENDYKPLFSSSDDDEEDDDR